VVVCDLCGARPPHPDEPGAVEPGAAEPGAAELGAFADQPTEAAGVLPLTWVTSVENGRPKVYCDRCAREHLRSIESKLDSEWW